MALNQIKNLFFILGLAMICCSAAIAQIPSAQLVNFCKTNMGCIFLDRFSSVYHHASKLSVYDRITSNFKGKVKLNGMEKDHAVLLHGIAKTKRSMHALEKALLKENYYVLIAV